MCQCVQKVAKRPAAGDLCFIAPLPESLELDRWLITAASMVVAVVGGSFGNVGSVVS